MAIQFLPAVIQRYLKAYSEKNVDAVVECLSPDVRFENVSNHSGQMSLEGRDRFREVAGQSVGAFSERRQDVLDAVGSGDQQNGRWAIEIELHATLAVDMGEQMPKGSHMHLRGISFITIKDGLITKITDFS